MTPPVYAIGIGCRKGVTAQDVVALVTRARAAAGHAAVQRARLFTLDVKSGEPGLREAARMLGAALEGFPRRALAQAMPGVSRTSARVESIHGVGSIAEAAALAGAGAGARLVVPRMSADGVTCAIALAAEGPA